MIRFAYPLPWWALALAMLALVLLAASAYWRTFVHLTRTRRAGLVTLRAIVLLAVGALFLRPMIHLPISRQGSVVPILVDVSPSMGIRDAGGVRRIDRAASLVTERVLPRLAGHYHPEVVTFADSAVPFAGGHFTLRGHHTNLAAAIAAVGERFRGQSVAGIVVVSDGVDSQGEDPARVVGATPSVFSLGVGSELLPDQEVRSVTAGAANITESTVALNVSAISRALGSAPFELRLLANGRPIATRRVTPAADGVPVQETFPVSPDPAMPTLYTIEIPLAAGDLVPENNRRSVVVAPPGRRRRVLFVQGAPGFEHTFLQRALALDPGLDVDAVVRKGRDEQDQNVFLVQGSPERSAALTSGYPRTREGLFAYDSVVLANVDWSAFTREQLQMTADFVASRGGGLLVLGTRAFEPGALTGTPLDAVLPVDRGGARKALARTSNTPGGDADGGTFKAGLTPAGRQHPIMRLADAADENERKWAAMPALSGSATPGSPRAGASVLATTTDAKGAVRSLVAVESYGRGRSMIFAGEASWRWKMLLPSNDPSYDVFWRQAIRWVAGAAPDPVTIAPLENVQIGDVAGLSITVADAGFRPVSDAAVVVEVAGPDAAQVLKATLANGAAGRYTVPVSFARAGIYRLSAHALRGATELGSGAQVVMAGAADSEFADPHLARRTLERLSEATGGRYVAAGDITNLPDLLARSVAAQAAASERDVWHEPAVFIVLLGLLVAEWVLRRRWGLR